MCSKQSKVSKQTDNVLYRDKLDPVERARYYEKLKIIGEKDPYVLKTFSSDVNLLPTVSYPDIVNYLLFTPSPYTKDQLKCYKGLDAYNKFICGSVSCISTVIIDSKHVVKAKVLHSMRIREKTLNVWLISEQDGNIQASHCDCMAGCGEVCTHVASVLFAIDGTVRIRDSRTVTQEPAYWLLPATMKNVKYSEVRDINFCAAKTLKKRFDQACDNPTNLTLSAKKAKRPVPETSTEESAEFFKTLNATGRKSAILSIVEPYADNYIPKKMSETFPKMLQDLGETDAMTSDYKQLLDLCKDIKIEASAEEIKRVEMCTREQSQNKLWFQFRAGRITSSKIKNVCSTDIANPSQSLIKAICYPEKSKFTSEAVEWGMKNETRGP